MSKIRAKMPVSDRAKQFSPFAAVRGLDEALEQKRREKCREEKKVLSEDSIKEINAVLYELNAGQSVWVRFYDDGIYKTVLGDITEISSKYKTLYIENTEISFYDIEKIKKQNN